MISADTAPNNHHAILKALTAQIFSELFDKVFSANDASYRTFFVITSKFGVVVFHAFKKKMQKTPQKEIETGRKRLKEMLTELEG